MAIMTCRDCGHKVSTRAERCPSCGWALPLFAHSDIADTMAKWTLGILVAWFCLYQAYVWVAGRLTEGWKAIASLFS